MVADPASRTGGAQAMGLACSARGPSDLPPLPFSLDALSRAGILQELPVATSLGGVSEVAPRNADETPGSVLNSAIGVKKSKFSRIRLKNWGSVHYNTVENAGHEV